MIHEIVRKLIWKTGGNGFGNSKEIKLILLYFRSPGVICMKSFPMSIVRNT